MILLVVRDFVWNFRTGRIFLPSSISMRREEHAFRSSSHKSTVRSGVAPRKPGKWYLSTVGVFCSIQERIKIFVAPVTRTRVNSLLNRLSRTKSTFSFVFKLKDFTKISSSSSGIASTSFHIYNNISLKIFSYTS